jgi:hypothetical protein
MDIPLTDYAIAANGGFLGRYSACKACRNSCARQKKEQKKKIANKEENGDTDDDDNHAADDKAEREEEENGEEEEDGDEDEEDDLQPPSSTPLTAGERTQKAKCLNRPRRDAEGSGATSKWCNQCLEV